MKCFNCDVNIKEILTEIDNGVEKLLVCPNDAILSFVLKPTISEEFIRASKHPCTCEICDSPGFIIKEFQEAKFNLCEKHMKDLFARNLSPEDYFKLYEKWGEVYLLHDDFYDPVTGIAFNPVK